MTTTYPPTHAPPRPTRTGSRSLVAIGNEVGKGLRQAWAERVQIIVELPLFAMRP